MAITAQIVSFGFLFVFSVLVPTVVVAAIASFTLVSAARMAGLWAWLLSGVLVPVAAAFGFLGTTILAGRILDGHWNAVVMPGQIIAVAVTITVPLGLVGHLLLRWLIKSLFYSSRFSELAP
jgi:hypothetical protein